MKKSKKRDSLTEREQELIKRYCKCSLGMTPQQMLAKWPLEYVDLAQICHRHENTVALWLCQGKSRRFPTSHDLRHLAILDFLLEHYEDIPAELRDVLCPLERDV